MGPIDISGGEVPSGLRRASTTLRNAPGASPLSPSPSYAPRSRPPPPTGAHSRAFRGNDPASPAASGRTAAARRTRYSRAPTSNAPRSDESRTPRLECHVSDEPPQALPATLRSSPPGTPSRAWMWMTDSCAATARAWRMAGCSPPSAARSSASTSSSPCAHCARATSRKQATSCSGASWTSRGSGGSWTSAGGKTRSCSWAPCTCPAARSAGETRWTS